MLILFLNHLVSLTPPRHLKIYFQELKCQGEYFVQNTRNGCICSHFIYKWLLMPNFLYFSAFICWTIFVLLDLCKQTLDALWTKINYQYFWSNIVLLDFQATYCFELILHFILDALDCLFAIILVDHSICLWIKAGYRAKFGLIANVPWFRFNTRYCKFGYRML